MNSKGQMILIQFNILCVEKLDMLSRYGSWPELESGLDLPAWSVLHGFGLQC